MTGNHLVATCPACSAVGPARSLSVIGSSIEFVCDRCGARTRLASYGADDTPAQSAIDFDSDTERGGKPNLTPPAGGVARDPRLADKLAVVEGVATLAPDLATRYLEIVRSGDQLEQHRALVNFASVSKRLEQMGVIYRFRLQRLPDDTVAREMRELVMQLAMAELASGHAKRPGQTTSSRVGLVAAILFIVLGLAASFYLLVKAFQPPPELDDEEAIEAPVSQ